MRAIMSILSPLVLAGILLFAFAAAVLGEDLSELSPRRAWHSLANGRTEFDVSDLALVPGQLAPAAEQSGCRYEDGIKEVPIHFISVEDRRLAIMYCPLVANGSQQIFDLS